MPIQQVIFELNRIQAAGLISAYAIGGAVAAQAYIETASTVDVDVFVAFGKNATSSLAPLADIWADLVSHGAKADDGYLVIGDWPVQFLPPGTPLYDDAISNARTKDFGGEMGRITGPEHFAAIALATGRDKDYPRVAEFISTGNVDLPTLMALIERFGLTDRWKVFQTRFPATNA